MIIRGSYPISQTDRTLDEQTLKSVALNEILKQVGEQAMAAFGSSVQREAESNKYPYGRFVLDVNIDLIN